MNTIITFVKSLRLTRILGVFLVGTFLLISTPYTSQSIGKTSYLTDYDNQKSSAYKLNENVDKLLKESYKTEPPQGGMNNHQDVDRRQNTSEAQAKAKDLVKHAQKNLQQGTGNFNDKIQETLGNLKDGVGESAQQIKEGTQTGFKNIKSTVDKVSDNIQQAVSTN